MIRKQFLTLSVLLLGAALFNFVSAAQAKKADVRSLIQASYDDWALAFRHKDLSRLRQNVERDSTPDFIWVGTDGKKVSREKAMDEDRNLAKSFDSVHSCTFHIRKLMVKGNIVTTVTDGYFSGIMRDAHGKPHSMSNTYRATDRWIQTRNGWKTNYFHILRDHPTWDGKPITWDKMMKKMKA